MKQNKELIDKFFSNNKCECGCGQTVKPGNRFVYQHHWYGRQHKPETIKLMSEAAKGKIKSEEHRKNLSKANKGKQAGKKHKNFGKHLPEKTRKLISEGNKGKKRTEEMIQKNRESHIGKTHSEKTKKLMSEQRKGKSKSEEHKKNIGKGNKGKKRTEEQRKNISEAGKGRQTWLGKHHTEEAKKNISEAKKEYYIKHPETKRKGKKHWNWKGGISFEPYCPEFFDKEYRQSLQERDNNGKCQSILCYGKTYKKKNSIHHINYKKTDCRPCNLITLCLGCNTRANNQREWWEEFYTYIMRGTINEVMKDIEKFTL